MRRDRRSSTARPLALVAVLAAVATLATVPCPVVGSVRGAEQPDERAVTLTVRVECVDSRRGTVRIALFDSAETHLREARRAELLSAAVRPVVWRVRGLRPGHYSLAVFHDLDDDEVLDRGFLGRPTEPYAFSNGQRGRFGRPSWERSRIAVAEDRVAEVCLK